MQYTALSGKSLRVQECIFEVQGTVSRLICALEGELLKWVSLQLRFQMAMEYFGYVA
jgi:hypothetical protein